MIDFVKLHRKIAGYTDICIRPFVKLFSRVAILNIFFTHIRSLDSKYRNTLDEKFFSKLNICSIFISRISRKIYNLFTIQVENPYIQNSDSTNLDLLLYAKKTAIKWRRFAFLIVFIFTIQCVTSSVLSKSKNNKNPSHVEQDGYIANISISGVISGNKDIYESLRKIRDNESIKAVILRVDSPGGMVYPSEKIYQAIRQIDAKKPVVTVMEGVAASGGYMIAMAGRYIFAMPSTITGSIGVYTSSLNVMDLTNKLGIKMHYTKSTPIKGSPNPFENTSPDVVEKEREMILDIYNLFRKMVSERRNIQNELLDLVSNGQVFLAQRALQYKLIDAIGDDESAKDWLYENKLVKDKLQIRNIDLEPIEKLNKYSIFGNIAKAFADSFIIGAINTFKNEITKNHNDVSL